LRFLKRKNSPVKRFAAHEEDPLSWLANLFDIAMVFAVGLLVSLVSAYRLHDLLDPETDMTMVKNPNDPEKMEIITKKGKEIKARKVTQQEAEGMGERLGVAYRLQDGRVIYVPQGE